MNDEVIVIDEPVHEWFGLSYANYAVLPRSGMQSMPAEWQRRFVQLMAELDDAIPEEFRLDGEYRVQCVTHDGKFTRDPCPHYDRGRTRLW